MCGRYVTQSSPALLAERFAAVEVRIPELEPNFNVAPRTKVPVVAVREDHRVLDLLRWGLVPSWAKEEKIGDRLINARAETVATKPAYRRAFAKRRCIIPADGFYEWRKLEDRKQKQPYFVFRRDREPLAFAGLWEIWHDPERDDAERVRSCVIVTTNANRLMAPVHDRMPVILPEAAWQEWLDPDNHDVEQLQRLLVPAADDVLEMYEVSTRVNRPTNKGRDLIERIPPEESLLAR
jgi:putative SOS response-associated peptidase YedK